MGRKLTDTSAVHNVHIFFTAALLHFSSQLLETTRSDRHQLKLESPTLRLCVNVDFLAFYNFVYSLTIYRSILQFSGFFNQTSIDELKLESPILLGYV